jgi:hypothetical protein
VDTARPAAQPPKSDAEIRRAEEPMSITLTYEERETLVCLLTFNIEHMPLDRESFNRLVELRARIGGHLE